MSQHYNPMAFKDELEKDFIPAIKEMVKKQKEHIAFLKARAKKKSYFHLLNSEAVDIDEIIQNAEEMVYHLEERLKEYKEYAEKLKPEKIK